MGGRYQIKVVALERIDTRLHHLGRDHNLILMRRPVVRRHTILLLLCQLHNRQYSTRTNVGSERIKSMRGTPEGYRIWR